MRVVSLLASATEIVCALGAGDMLVGRSHECDNPDWVRSLPSCSEPAFDISVSSREIDAEVRRRIRTGEPLYIIHAHLIRELKPDLIVTQSHCDVCAVTPADVERQASAVMAGMDQSGACAIGANQVALSASTVEGIFDCIQILAGRLGLPERGSEIVQRERARLENVRQRTMNLRRPTVVMLEWTDPVFAMGNWGPELVEIANGDLLLGKKGEFSAAIPAEQIREVDPEFLIVAPCGFNLQRALKDRSVLARYPWWHDLRAVRSGNLVFADGSLFFNRSGMTITQTAEIVAEILHGVEFGSKTEGIHWQRVSERVSPTSHESRAALHQRTVVKR